jgi:hypothetical protein
MSTRQITAIERDQLWRHWRSDSGTERTGHTDAKGTARIANSASFVLLLLSELLSYTGKSEGPTYVGAIPEMETLDDTVLVGICLLLMRAEPDESWRWIGGVTLAAILGVLYIAEEWSG